jgi:hypothetical protein
LIQSIDACSESSAKTGVGRAFALLNPASTASEKTIARIMSSQSLPGVEQHRRTISRAARGEVVAQTRPRVY